MRRSLSMLIAGSVLMAACGTSSSSDTTASQVDPTAAPVTLPRGSVASSDPIPGPTTSVSAAPTTMAEAAPPNLFPDVEVIEIATGESVNLQSLGVIDRPVLLWFWAPH